jgi:hypothetical protein
MFPIPATMLVAFAFLLRSFLECLILVLPKLLEVFGVRILPGGGQQVGVPVALVPFPIRGVQRHVHGAAAPPGQAAQFVLPPLVASRHVWDYEPAAANTSTPDGVLVNRRSATGLLRLCSSALLNNKSPKPRQN